MSSQVYEIIKTIYATTDPHNTSPEARIKILQSTLGQLRLNNIATLDAITTHFTRLIDLTSADEAYITNLAQVLSPCILRPRTENSLTLSERHAYRLIRDLFDHKDAIFGELKRQSSGLANSGGPAGAGPRNRAVSSTDESNRRANMEARAKAISERTRERSPGPANRHRRDGSTGAAPMTRFPVVASPTSAPEKQRGAPARHSLEVPGSNEASPVVETPTTHTSTAMKSSLPSRAETAPSNGNSESQSTFSGGGPGPHIPPPSDSPDSASGPISEPSSAVEKRDSLTRGTGSGGRYTRKPGLGRQSLTKRESLADGPEGRSLGVTLEDKPMDD